MLTKEQKKNLVKDLSSKIKASKSVVFADFRGLQVKDLDELKKELRGAGADFKVAKKTLINLALKEAGIKADTKKMEGQIAISISSQDEVAPAKIINTLSKKNENIKMVGGLLGTTVMTLEEVKALAKLPSKDELLAKLVGSLQSPIRGFVQVCAGNLRGLVQVLKAVADSKQ